MYEIAIVDHDGQKHTCPSVHEQMAADFLQQVQTMVPDQFVIVSDNQGNRIGVRSDDIKAWSLVKIPNEGTVSEG